MSSSPQGLQVKGPLANLWSDRASISCQTSPFQHGRFPLKSSSIKKQIAQDIHTITIINHLFDLRCPTVLYMWMRDMQSELWAC